MSPVRGQQWTPVVITVALVATAVTVSAVRGSAQAAVVAVLVGALIIAHFVRRRVRERLVYDHRDTTPDRPPATPDETRHTTATTQGRPG